MAAKSKPARRSPAGAPASPAPVTVDQADQATSAAQPVPSHQLYSQDEVLALTSMTRQTLWRARRDPAVAFPQPVKLTPGRVAFVASEVHAWIEARMAARPSRPAPPGPTKRKGAKR